MEVRFADPALDRLETDPHFTGGFGRDVVRGYRKAMRWVHAARDERDFRNLKGLHYKKLETRPSQRSMRITKQFRLIVEVDGTGESKVIVIVAIEDYH